jgi:hypothetical protein
LQLERERCHLPLAGGNDLLRSRSSRRPSLSPYRNARSDARSLPNNLTVKVILLARISARLNNAKSQGKLWKWWKSWAWNVRSNLNNSAHLASYWMGQQVFIMDPQEMVAPGFRDRRIRVFKKRPSLAYTHAMQLLSSVSTHRTRGALPGAPDLPLSNLPHSRSAASTINKRHSTSDYELVTHIACPTVP